MWRLIRHSFSVDLLFNIRFAHSLVGAWALISSYQACEIRIHATIPSKLRSQDNPTPTPPYYLHSNLCFPASFRTRATSSSSSDSSSSMLDKAMRHRKSPNQTTTCWWAQKLLCIVGTTTTYVEKAERRSQSRPDV